MCRSITVFRLEIERRFKAEPTQHFEPPSTDFISALGINTRDSLIAAEQVDNMLGLLCLFISNSVSSVYFCSSESSKIDIKQFKKNPKETRVRASTSRRKRRRGRKEGWERVAVFPGGKQLRLSVFFPSHVHQQTVKCC